MSEIFDIRDKIAASEGDEDHMLGKFLYFSLANLLVEKDALSKLCEDLDIPYTGGKRLSVADAFRSATGDIQERIPVTQAGESHIYLAYCRQAEELFEMYQRCANRKQVETICTNFLRSIEATKLSVTGYLYFVPRTFMEKVDVFEEFLGFLGKMNQRHTPLMVNSFYIIDDEKQRGKMTEEFYAAVKKEIAEHQERADYFIHSGCQSPAVLERWALKIQGLEGKKRHYEQVLRRELDGLDDEFGTLKFLGQELQARAKNIRFQKAA